MSVLRSQRGVPDFARFAAASMDRRLESATASCVSVERKEPTSVTVVPDLASPSSAEQESHSTVAAGGPALRTSSSTGPAGGGPDVTGGGTDVASEHER